MSPQRQGGHNLLLLDRLSKHRWGVVVQSLYIRRDVQQLLDLRCEVTISANKVLLIGKFACKALDLEAVVVAIGQIEGAGDLRSGRACGD
jgi:hypothetical protein